MICGIFLPIYIRHLQLSINWKKYVVLIPDQGENMLPIWLAKLGIVGRKTIPVTCSAEPGLTYFGNTVTLYPADQLASDEVI